MEIHLRLALTSDSFYVILCITLSPAINPFTADPVKALHFAILV